VVTLGGERGDRLTWRALSTPLGRLIFTLLLFLERFLARVLLSTVPMYYEMKLALLLWLLFSDGSEALYRRLRRHLLDVLPFFLGQ
jgi:hypothetical protein